MASIPQFVLITALITIGLVTSFSISSRSERDTDLAEALAILQRQRRRVGVEDFLNTERLLQGQPLTLDDVTDWLRRDQGNDVTENRDLWAPSSQSRFSDNFDSSDIDNVLADGMPRYSTGLNYVLPPTRTKASDNELNDIFDSVDENVDDENDKDGINNNETRGGEQTGNDLELSKKVKEEVFVPQGDRKTHTNRETKQNSVGATFSSDAAVDAIQKAKDIESAVSKNRAVLNSLTDEELRVLMKAVGKLQEDTKNDLNKEKKSIDSDGSSPANEEFIVGSSHEIPEEGNLLVSEPVTQEELKSVFTESNGPNTKETVIVESKGPNENSPTIVGKQIFSEKLPDDTTLVRERELTHLLPDVIQNEIEKENSDDENHNDDDEETEAAKEMQREIEEITQGANEEVENLLQNTDDEQNAINSAEEEMANELVKFEKQRLSPELVSKYLLMKNNMNIPQNVQGHITKRTAKRASGMVSNNMAEYSPSAFESFANSVDQSKALGDSLSDRDTSALIEAFVAKILTLQKEIDRLKFRNSLEDLENDQLTDALNEATLGQKEGTVSGTEWKSLQHAIQIESALQDMKTRQSDSLDPAVLADVVNEVENSMNDGDDGEGDDNGDVVNDREDIDNQMEEKRGEPWKRVPDPNDDVYSGMIASRSSTPTDQGITSEDIANLLKSGSLLALDNDELNRRLEGEVEEEEDEEEEEEGRRLGELIDGIRDDEELDGEEDVSSLFLPNARQCPAVRLYSTNCELADLFHLPIDYEARALCNLHHMCYTCGHSLGVTQPQCDLVYQAAVSSLCRGKTPCEDEADTFLHTMKLKHRYLNRVQPTCRATCTAQFMGMF